MHPGALPFRLTAARVSVGLGGVRAGCVRVIAVTRRPEVSNTWSLFQAVCKPPEVDAGNQSWVLCSSLLITEPSPWFSI